MRRSAVQGAASRTLAVSPRSGRTERREPSHARPGLPDRRQPRRPGVRRRVGSGSRAEAAMSRWDRRSGARDGSGRDGPVHSTRRSRGPPTSLKKKLVHDAAVGRQTVLIGTQPRWSEPDAWCPFGSPLQMDGGCSGRAALQTALESKRVEPRSVPLLHSDPVSGHPLDPLRTRRTRRERVAKILDFPDHIPLQKHHDTRCVRRLSVIRQNIFGDPETACFDDPPNRKAFPVRLRGARQLNVLPSADALA